MTEQHIRQIRYLFDKRYIKLLNGEIIKEGAMFANKTGELFSIKLLNTDLQNIPVTDALGMDFFNRID